MVFASVLAANAHYTQFSGSSTGSEKTLQPEPAAILLACNFNCKNLQCQLKLPKMATRNLRVGPDAEKRLRTVIANGFRSMVMRYGSEQAAAESLGISRQRFKKYLDKEMTPKADVLLVAMANGLKIVHEGVAFSANAKSKKIKPPIPEQLTLNYFDEPQILRDDHKNVEVRVSRKQLDRLKFAVEICLAG